MESILASISIGLLSTASPCVLPLYPGYLAYIAGGQSGLGNSRGRYFLGFFVLAGVLSMMLVLGGLIALLSISVGRALSFVLPAADLLIIALGVMLLLNINVFKKLPQIQVPALSHPLCERGTCGLLYGPIALPCSGPLLVTSSPLAHRREALSKLGCSCGSDWGLACRCWCFPDLGAAQKWIRGSSPCAPG
jgi:cytochrome c-type biogenesis protein